MYPNLYYVFKDWFGVEWHGLSFLNTFGLDGCHGLCNCRYCFK